MAWIRSQWALVLAGGLVMGLTLGTRHVQGLFLIPITLDRAWSREFFGIAMALQNLAWGIFQPVAGMWADQFGTRKVMITGAMFYVAGLWGMTFATSPSAFILTAGLMVGIGLSGTTIGVIYSALSRLVAPRRRAWALGMSGAIGGAGQFFLVPLAQRLIDALSWSGALMALALLVALVLPLAAILKDHPVHPVQAEGATAKIPSITEAIREAFRHSGFWLLALGFFACGFQLAFIGMHLPAYLVDSGLSPSAGVAALATIAIANVIGIYVLSVMGNRVRRKYLLTSVYLARVVTMTLFLFTPLSAASVMVFSATMGFLWLGTVPLTNGLVSQVFGVRYLSTLFGFVFLSHQLGAFLGVWLGGYVYDATGSYNLIWLVAVGLGLLSAALHWPINDRELVRLPVAESLA